MQKYEKILHLDQNYKKLQEMNWIQTISTLVWIMVVYVCFFYISRYAMRYVPDQSAWNGFKVLTSFGRVSFLTIDLLYFICGFITMCYGGIRLVHITKQNHSVREADNPNKLLTDGYYTSVRHPMYGTFIILYSGLFLTMRSRNGLIIAFLIWLGQYLNAYFEEKKLRILFKDEFMIYCKKTKARVLTKVQMTILILIFIITLLGLVIPIK